MTPAAKTPPVPGKHPRGLDAPIVECRSCNGIWYRNGFLSSPQLLFVLRRQVFRRQVSGRPEAALPFEAKPRQHRPNPPPWPENLPREPVHQNVSHCMFFNLFAVEKKVFPGTRLKSGLTLYFGTAVYLERHARKTETDDDWIAGPGRRGGC